MYHLHFTQSVEVLQGAGLGQAALSLHNSLLKNEDCESLLFTTCNKNFTSLYDNVLIGKRFGPEKLFYSPELYSLSKNYIKQADIFHGHGLYVYTNFLFGSLARKNKKPLVYHPHGFFDPWILKRSRKKKLLVDYLFERKNIQYVKWWRALTTKEADQIRNHVSSSSSIHVVPNGIDISEIDSAIDCLRTCPDTSFTNIEKKRPLRLLFLSRLHPKKGLDLLISVWADITSLFPDWELVIVGPDEAGYKSVLDKLIIDLCSQESCRILPPTSGLEKQYHYQLADVFVLPSYSEGFPMAVLEAAAHSLPIIHSTECNFPELANSGGGIEFAPRFRQLKSAMIQMLELNVSDRIQIGSNARILVERNYTWPIVAKKINSLCSFT